MVGGSYLMQYFHNCHAKGLRNHSKYGLNQLEMIFHMFRCLKKIRPSAILLNIYKFYVQSKIDYGLSSWRCTTQVSLNHVQQIQNLLTGIIYNNFDYIHSLGMDLVWSLKL